MIQGMTTETVQKKLFTVEEFHHMCEVGILLEDGRFELIRGEVFEMPKPKPPHSGRVDRLTRMFTLMFREAAIVRVQGPVFLNTHSEPFPDLAILKSREDFYEVANPGPHDTLLIVEVSNTSVSYDSNVKASLYAEAGIPEYWQVDIKKEILVVRTDPQDGDYHTVRIYHRGESISPRELSAFTFPVDDILG